MTQRLPDFPIIMIRDNMDNIPFYVLPSGFYVRKFRPGDEVYWAEVEYAAGEFESSDAALSRFVHEFGNALDEMEDRCFFLVNEEGERVIGTATAWYDLKFRGEEWGRVHWVAIIPEFQGRKLAKPLMSVVMQRLRQSHNKAYLKTHTKCLKAINMYLDFGFQPSLEYPTCEEAWRQIASLIDHPALNELRRSTSQ